MPEKNAIAAPGEFNRALQERFRGARDETKQRLRVYLPFLEAVKAVCGGGDAIDLGCGRGEWLELLTEGGFHAFGVDRDEATVAAVRARGADARTGDALDALACLPDASQSLVSAFHLAEHMSFIDLQSLVRQAHRVLAPAGLLIVETPNPENLAVATTNFYLDPTHLRPIPPQLLSFLAEFFGFARFKLLRLQEWPGVAGAAFPTLAQIVGGASADYAIVAQKAGHAAAMEATAAPFAAEVGVSRDALIARYDEKMALHLRALDLYAQTLANEISLKNENLMAKEAEILRLSRTSIELQHALADACARAAVADARVAALETELAGHRRAAKPSSGESQ